MTEKLTAQQKRDRQQAQLLANLQAEWEEETRRTNNENYTLGMDQGADMERYIFSKLSLWNRINYPRNFRKNI